MNIHFLFLRAINVGGHNTIKMTDLALWMQQLGFTGVKTYLNSGNIIFQTERNDTPELEKLIRQKILLQTKLDIPCFIRNLDDLMCINTILSNHEAQKSEASTVFLTLLSGKPSAQNIEKLKAVKSDPDNFTAYGTELVLVCQQPYHKTKLSNSLFEKTLKMDATSRNRNTVEAMLLLRGDMGK